MEIPKIIDFISIRESLYYASNDWKALPFWVRDEYELGNIIFLNREIFLRKGDKELSGIWNEYLIRDSSLSVNITKELTWRKIK